MFANERDVSLPFAAINSMFIITAATIKEERS